MKTNKIGFIIGAVLAGAILLTGTGCTKQEPVSKNSEQELSSETETPGVNNPEKTYRDLYDTISGSVNLPEMYLADDDYVLNYYGIDKEKLEDGIFASSTDPTRTDSIILIRLKDEAYAEEAERCLNLLLEQMEAEMENYNPEANELVKAASVRKSGTHMDLIICDERDTVLSLIDDSLK